MFYHCKKGVEDAVQQLSPNGIEKLLGNENGGYYNFKQFKRDIFHASIYKKV